MSSKTENRLSDRQWRPARKHAASSAVPTSCLLSTHSTNPTLFVHLCTNARAIARPNRVGNRGLFWSFKSFTISEPEYYSGQVLAKAPPHPQRQCFIVRPPLCYLSLFSAFATQTLRAAGDSTKPTARITCDYLQDSGSFHPRLLLSDGQCIAGASILPPGKARSSGAVWAA